MFEPLTREQKPKPKPKPKPKGRSLVSITKNDDGTQTTKPVVLINEYAQVGEDADFKPIRAWVQKERSKVAEQILNTLQMIGVELFNTNGFISCFDPSTNDWDLFDDTSKILVLIDTYIRCGKGSHIKGSRVYEPVDTPKNVGDFLLHSKEKIMKLDSVSNLLRHPYFDNNFNLVNKEGYNENTKCYMPKSAVIPDDAWKITLQEAYDIFEEAFGSMNYRADIDKQADFASFLTPPWRLVVGKTPIIAVNSNVPGSGKGLRQRLVNKVWTDMSAPIISKPESKDEVRKQLFSCVKTGQCFIFIDNISDIILSDAICSYATEPVISDRSVYGRKVETYKNDLMISVNGNNLRMSEDISTRILPINFDMNQSSLVRDYAAEGRKTESEITSYVEDNRDRIIGASIRISKEYINDMFPKYPTGASRFDKWRQYVLGSVYHLCESLGVDYLLDGVTIKSKIDVDTESQSRATLWKAILDIVGVDPNNSEESRPFFTGLDEACGIFDLASHLDRVGRNKPIGHDILGEYISGHTERARMTKLGIYIRDKAVGKIHYGWRMVKANPIRVNRAPKTAYKLVLVNKSNFYAPGTENWNRPTHENVEDVADPLEGINL